MGLRGSKPKGKVRIEWSPNFAYAIGLLASDGHVSKDGRHIDLTSKDKEQLENFSWCLGLDSKIGSKRSGNGMPYGRVQFGDVLFYRFLLEIGLSPAKSKTMGEIKIPKKYFFDFLHGSFDGDGCFYSYFDPRWKSSFMFYTTFISASAAHIDWLRLVIFQELGDRGHISADGRKRTLQLKYAKGDSWKILKSMYYSDTVVCLARKRLKIEKALEIARGAVKKA
jgi:hypothetical protein